LILAEEEGVGRETRGRGVEDGAAAACHSHLGDRDEKPAVRQVVAADNMPGANHAAYEVAVSALCRKVNRR